jgi:catechol 2,3-dioxygenase-like lactoylglutathione lyase family enzyme
MAKITGIGGVFLKCKDPKAVNEWYETHLGMDVGEYGANFEWRDAEDPKKEGSTAWNTFPENTKYFEPSTKDFMVNYRVDNLEAMVEYGKFVHIVDVEGNKVQLWEPIDEN